MIVYVAVNTEGYEDQTGEGELNALWIADGCWG